MWMMQDALRLIFNFELGKASIVMKSNALVIVANVYYLTCVSKQNTLQSKLKQGRLP